MKRRKQTPEGGANWMDTYGDLVTLLLCFFVLLYSMSTLDQQKWESLVRSFNPDSIPAVTETVGNEGPIADPTTGTNQEDIQASIDQLYDALKNYVGQQGAQTNISVSKGDGYVFLSMNNTVFFDGDSYVLRRSGQQVLDDLAVILAKVGSSIDEIRIMGHTAQATSSGPNNPSVDRFLASNRATTVLLYLQEKQIVDPARLISVSYGQWRPISSNDTAQARAKNRRVEFIIAGKQVENSMSDSIAQYYSLSGVVPPVKQGDSSSSSPDQSTLTPP